jgi:hypothetical protein
LVEVAQCDGNRICRIGLARHATHSVDPFQGPAHFLLARGPVPGDRQLHLGRGILTDLDPELGRGQEHHAACPGHRHGAGGVSPPHQALDRHRLRAAFLQEIPDRPIQRPEALGLRRTGRCPHGLGPEDRGTRRRRADATRRECRNPGGRGPWVHANHQSLEHAFSVIVLPGRVNYIDVIYLCYDWLGSPRTNRALSSHEHNVHVSVHREWT